MPKTARARFVEAMRGLYDYIHAPQYFAPDGYFSNGDKLWRQAIDAFADAECALNPGCRFENRINEEEWRPDHAACRASLRKECGL